MSTDTDKLIDRLSGDLKPVRPLLPAALRAGFICAFSLAAVFGGIFAVSHGLRTDLAIKLTQAHFALQAAALLAAGVLAALAACQLCVPDTKIRWPVRCALGIAGGIWLGVLGAALTAGSVALVAFLSGGNNLRDFATTTAGGENCLTDFSLLAALPLAAICFLMTRGAPVWRGLAGFAMTLAVGSFAALGMRLLCPNDDAGHLLAWHFLPVLAFALAGVGLGKILLKKKIAKI